MPEENISQEFRLKNIDETRNYLIEDINQIELMSNDLCFYFWKKMSLLISYCIFSSIILSSIVIISFYIISKRFFLKHEELSDTRVVSITKKEYGFAVHFL